MKFRIKYGKDDFTYLPEYLFIENLHLWNSGNYCINCYGLDIMEIDMSKPINK